MSLDQLQDYEGYVSDLQSLLAKLTEEKYFKQLTTAFSIIKQAADNNNLIISCVNGGSA